MSREWVEIYREVRINRMVGEGWAFSTMAVGDSETLEMHIRAPDGVPYHCFYYELSDDRTLTGLEFDYLWRQIRPRRPVDLAVITKVAKRLEPHTPPETIFTTRKAAALRRAAAVLMPRDVIYEVVEMISGDAQIVVTGRAASTGPYPDLTVGGPW